jgi:hypothetical protein
MTPEASLKQSVVKYLDGIGAIYYNNIATKFSKAGYPDMMVWYRGIGFLLEFKVKGNYPSAIQKAWSHKLANAGVIDVIAYDLASVEEVIELIDTAYEDSEPLELLKLKADEVRYNGRTK